MAIGKNLKKIEQVLTRGVETVLPGKEGLRSLMQKRKIRVYLGVDPTSPRLHLGHAIPLRKLKEFQDLGHEVILLFGTFTAQIGDPSGRDEKRKPLSPLQIKENIASYTAQASKVLGLKKANIKYNNTWLAKLSFGDLTKIASHFTVARLLERDMFQKRIKKGGEVWLSELLYPLMQGYDSVAMDVDLEVGGNDQTFNMLVGRRLQMIYRQREKYILTTPMLLGLDGRKMSKTYGNTVNIADSAKDMYGKIMSLKDELIVQYFELCTNLPPEKIKEMEKNLAQRKINPKNAKELLAREIVAVYRGEKEARAASREFNRVFKEKGLPEDIPLIKIKEKSLNILTFLLKTKMVSSKSEAKRLVLQGAVEINGALKKDWREDVEIKKGTLIKIGKRRFAKTF